MDTWLHTLDILKSIANACPLATRNLKVNTKNRNAAIKESHIQYGPMNPSDDLFWARLAKFWGTTPKVAQKSKCGNCAAFDTSPRMKKCMPGEVSDSEGRLGYCWMHNFKCHSARTCRTWAKGGPIKMDSISKKWQKKSQ